MDKFIVELLPYAIFLMLFPVVVAGVKRWFKARGKGMLGEYVVNAKLGRELPEGAYHVIPNVMLPTEPRPQPAGAIRQESAWVMTRAWD